MLSFFYSILVINADKLIGACECGRGFKWPRLFFYMHTKQFFSSRIVIQIRDYRIGNPDAYYGILDFRNIRVELLRSFH